ncbi:hypothetical protein T439DRAFT_377364 [Meredithblackwellia eburnea MCA 4105]
MVQQENVKTNPPTTGNAVSSAEEALADSVTPLQVEERITPVNDEDGDRGHEAVAESATDDAPRDSKHEHRVPKAGQAIYKALGSPPIQAETDAFECSKCKFRKTMYYQMESDGVLFTFVTCLVCDNKFRFC